MSTPGAGRPQRPARTGIVTRTERLTPHMVRIVLGGPGLAGFRVDGFADHYVKLVFPQPGAERPALRSYTVRRWDEAAGELTLDFVVHGDEGLAGPWAATARQGDEIALQGPGGEYTPDPTADWHLFVGDASALPAIAAALEQLPAQARAVAFLEVDGPDEEQLLAGPEDLTVTWLHTGSDYDPELLVRSLRSAQLPTGRVHAFVHGEASAVREVRRHLLAERAVARDDLSVSGYWKLGRTDEGWRQDKAEWKRLVELDA